MTRAIHPPFRETIRTCVGSGVWDRPRGGAADSQRGDSECFVRARRTTCRGFRKKIWRVEHRFTCLVLARIGPSGRLRSHGRGWSARSIGLEEIFATPVIGPCDQRGPACYWTSESSEDRGSLILLPLSSSLAVRVRWIASICSWSTSGKPNATRTKSGVSAR